MRLNYFIRRVGFFLVIVWLAATVNFFLPRLTGQDPIREKLMREAMLGGATQSGLDEIVKTYEIKFGLDRPYYVQYLTYLGDVLRFDFNYSIAHYPNRVIDMMADALPWTMGLLVTTTIISWTLGNLIGLVAGYFHNNRAATALEVLGDA